MKVVYVAGAYSAPDTLTLWDNMRRGIRLANAAEDAGFAAYVPWEDMQRHLLAERPRTIEECYARSMAIMERCHAVLVQPVRVEQSTGTQAEIARAEALGIPVFWDLDALILAQESEGKQE